MEFQLTFNVNENSPLYEGENNDTLQQSVGFALVDMLEGNEAAIKYLQDTITNIRSPNLKPARILDFGTESFGMSGADWVEESTEFVTGGHPQGLNIFAMRIKPGTPIPVPDNTYDFINLSHAIDFNEREDWPWLFDEFKRVLKKDGVMVITEGVYF
jgi:SAM-dependent methyltransferase